MQAYNQGFQRAMVQQMKICFTQLYNNIVETDRFHMKRISGSFSSTLISDAYFPLQRSPIIFSFLMMEFLKGVFSHLIPKVLAYASVEAVDGTGSVIKLKFNPANLRISVLLARQFPIFQVNGIINAA